MNDRLDDIFGDDRAKMLLEDPTMSIPCGCCGLTLTNPESIARGIGPTCAGKWGF